MIVGFGMDLVEIARIARIVEGEPAHAERFLARCFTSGERAYCDARRDRAGRYAARFAAKEAVSKCFSTGIGAELGWRSVSIYHGERHQPLVRLDEKAEALLRQVGATHVHVTLSHTETVAMAVAILVDNRSRT